MMDIIAIINETYRSAVHASPKNRDGDYAMCIGYGANERARKIWEDRPGFFTMTHSHYH